MSLAIAPIGVLHFDPEDARDAGDSRHPCWASFRSSWPVDCPRPLCCFWISAEHQGCPGCRGCQGFLRIFYIVFFSRHQRTDCFSREMEGLSRNLSRKLAVPKRFSKRISDIGQIEGAILSISGQGAPHQTLENLKKNPQIAFDPCWGFRRNPWNRFPRIASI